MSRQSGTGFASHQVQQDATDADLDVYADEGATAGYDIDTLQRRRRWVVFFAFSCRLPRVG